MNFFSDPQLRARQDVLDGQWNSLWGTYGATCENGLGNAFPEFATDYRNWKEFYGSESDWSTGSKHETDIWQTKAQEWSKRLKDYGCGDAAKPDYGIPGVKDPPPDEPGFFDDLKDAAKMGAISWVVFMGVLIGAVVLIFYFISKSNVPSLKVGQ